MAEPRVQRSVCLCAAILGLTLAAKVIGLLHGGGLLSQPHPFLYGTYKNLVWGGLITELCAFIVLAVYGVRPFLAVCLGLAILFIGYHTLQVALQVEAPCPCLGGLASRWKPLTQLESTLSFLLACCLGTASFTGLFSVAKEPRAKVVQQPSKVPTLAASCIWLLAAVIVLLLWHSRILGWGEGTEAAKSLQLLPRPESATTESKHIPTLWSIVGMEIFRFFGASLTLGRILVVISGLFLPITWAIYCSQFGLRYAALIATVMLWLIMPHYFAVFMPDVAAYSVGIAALLPLILRGHSRCPLLISSCVAILALSIKVTTAAFALIVVFTWLLQRSNRDALTWLVIVLLLVCLAAFTQHGWAWSAPELSFRLPHSRGLQSDALLYAHGWIVCALAIFAFAKGYLTNQLASLVPWLSAGIAGLIFHMFFEPWRDYDGIHVMTPLVLLAGIGLVELWRLCDSSTLAQRGRRWTHVAIIAIFSLWIWQRAAQILMMHDHSAELSTSPVTKELRSLKNAGRTVFAMDPVWSFAANAVQTRVELTAIPANRFPNQGVDYQELCQILAVHHFDALVLDQSSLRERSWSKLLTSYVPAARDHSTIVFVRSELHPIPIDLEDKTVSLRDLGL